MLFGLYLVFLLYLLFFSEQMGRTEGPRFSYNLEPLREIRRCLRHWRALGLSNAIMNLAGNVAAFLPFGFFIPELFEWGRGFFVVLFSAVLFSLCLETVQLLTQVGSFDVDDILLNTAGGILGFGIWAIWKKRRNKKGRK